MSTFKLLCTSHLLCEQHCSQNLLLMSRDCAMNQAHSEKLICPAAHPCMRLRLRIRLAHQLNVASQALDRLNLDCRGGRGHADGGSAALQADTPGACLVRELLARLMGPNLLSNGMDSTGC